MPASGVIYEGDQAHVWVLDKNGELALRRIKPGRSSGTLVEVLDGIAAGEQVVAGGALFIDRAASSD